MGEHSCALIIVSTYLRQPDLFDINFLYHLSLWFLYPAHRGLILAVKRFKTDVRHPDHKSCVIVRALCEHECAACMLVVPFHRHFEISVKNLCNTCDSHHVLKWDIDLEAFLFLETIVQVLAVRFELFGEQLVSWVVFVTLELKDLRGKGHLEDLHLDFLENVFESSYFRRM